MSRCVRPRLGQRAGQGGSGWRRFDAAVLGMDLHAQTRSRAPTPSPYKFQVELPMSRSLSQRAHQPLDFSPTGVLASGRPTHQQPEATAALGGQLQAAGCPVIHLLDLGNHRHDRWRTQRLIDGPQTFGQRARADDDQPLQIDPHGRGRRRIKLLAPVDQHAKTIGGGQGLSRRRERQRSRPAGTAGLQVLDHRATFVTTAGQTTIHLATAAAENSRRLPTPRPPGCGLLGCRLSCLG